MMESALVGGTGDRSGRALIGVAVGVGTGAGVGEVDIGEGAGSDAASDTDIGEGGGAADGVTVAGGCDCVIVKACGAVDMVVCVKPRLEVSVWAVAGKARLVL